MEAETPTRDPVLERAWQQHADLDLSANRRSQRFDSLRKWIAWLGILATLFAILTQQFFPKPLDTPEPPFQYYAAFGLGVKALFIAIPILASALAALAIKFYANGSWLIYRAGAEEVKKEIYLYRTILPKDTSRRDYLEKRLDEIQRNVDRNLGGKAAPKKYKGPLPPSHNKNKSKRNKTGDDSGFHDLSGDEYVAYRLKHQLDWHHNKILQRQRERLLMTLALLAIGGLGALLAAVGGFLGIWVAMTASITAALLGWQERKRVDEVIKNYSKVVLELNILYNHWQNLEPEERTPQEVEKTVLGCERLLWTQNREFVRSMQEALSQADLEKDAALINEMIRESKASAQRAKDKLVGNVIETGKEFLTDAEQRFDETFKQVFGSLAEQVSLEAIQKELEAMGQAMPDPAEPASEPEEVCFTSIYPREGQVASWQTLLVYVHLLSATQELRKDAQRFADRLPSPKEVTVHSSTKLVRGTELTIVPSCENVTFNPERLVVKWMEDYQRAEFRFRADPALADDAARGRINIYVGPLLVGTLPFAMLFSKTAPARAASQEEHSRMYRQEDIFVSYSHKDTAIALACKKAYEALGFNILIDADDLRSGQVWNDELMNMIDRASIFQLFWSQNSAQSKYCRQEWEHALERNREGFIRPVYWEKPIPKPPEELSKYHFEYMEFEAPPAARE